MTENPPKNHTVLYLLNAFNPNNEVIFHVLKNIEEGLFVFKVIVDIADLYARLMPTP